jgi:hypothetical protein
MTSLAHGLDYAWLTHGDTSMKWLISQSTSKELELPSGQFSNLGGTLTLSRFLSQYNIINRRLSSQQYLLNI